MFGSFKACDVKVNLKKCIYCKMFYIYVTISYDAISSVILFHVQTPKSNVPVLQFQVNKAGWIEWPRF